MSGCNTWKLLVSGLVPKVIRDTCWLPTVIPAPSSADNAACIPSSFTRSTTFPLLNSATLVIPVAPERMIVTLAVGKPPARIVASINDWKANCNFSSAFTLLLFARLIPNALYAALAAIEAKECIGVPIGLNSRITSLGNDTVPASVFLVATGNTSSINANDRAVSLLSTNTVLCAWVCIAWNTPAASAVLS